MAQLSPRQPNIQNGKILFFPNSEKTDPHNQKEKAENEEAEARAAVERKNAAHREKVLEEGRSRGLLFLPGHYVKGYGKTKPPPAKPRPPVLLTAGVDKASFDSKSNHAHAADPKSQSDREQTSYREF